MKIPGFLFVQYLDRGCRITLLHRKSTRTPRVCAFASTRGDDHYNLAPALWVGANPALAFSHGHGSSLLTGLRSFPSSRIRILVRDESPQIFAGAHGNRDHLTHAPILPAAVPFAPKTAPLLRIGSRTHDVPRLSGSCCHHRDIFFTGLAFHSAGGARSGPLPSVTYWTQHLWQACSLFLLVPSRTLIQFRQITDKEK
jgi:hypothetical protein